MYDKEDNIKIKGGHGHTPWASNLYPYRKDGGDYETPKLQIVAHGRTFTSVEAAYQASKAHFFDTELKKMYPEKDAHLFDLFPSTIRAMDAKRAAGKGTFAVGKEGFVATMWKNLGGTKAQAKRDYDVILNPKKGGRATTWFGVSIGIMRGLLEQKFEHPLFRELLQQTGTAKLYETKHRGGTLWERGGRVGVGGVVPSGWGVLGDLLMDIRERQRGGGT